MNQSTTAISQKESRTGGNDDKNQGSKDGCKKPLDKKEEAANAKRKSARVSIGKNEATSVGMMEEEGKRLGSSLAFSDSGGDSEDFVHVRKKQKTNLERLQEEGRATENGQEETKDDSEGDENDDLVHVREEATAVVVPMFVEDDNESPNKESFRKLKKWTNELLGLKKKLEDARVCRLYGNEYGAMPDLCFCVSDCVRLLLPFAFVFVAPFSLSKLENAVLLNKLYTAGAKRGNYV
mmetsp:Transcript_2204/g.4637  ORF Transcript_2204/g.4637 Transcript_2204/m.4637 type:complete len:237 (+) Transcript_2204:2060-2770(+)